MTALTPAPRPSSAPTPTAGHAALLDIRDLHVTYAGNRPAVRGVSLSVRAGEILGVIGESGSGKSTIALAAMGLLPPSAEVRAQALSVNGVDVRHAGPRTWAALRGAVAAMVFQEPLAALNPTMRIGRQVAQALRNHQVVPRQEIDREVIRLLELVHLPEPARRARQFPHQLSGGQLQRVVIAIALAARPSLLIADEPTTALDVTVQAGILRLLTSVRDQTGVGVLFVSHDLAVIANLTDRTAVMRDGRIVQEGPTGDVLHGEHHPYTAALLASLPGSVPPRHRLQVAAAADTSRWADS